MSNQHFLEKHPTPWRLVCQTAKNLSPDLRDSILANEYDDVRYVPHAPDRDVIVDANGDTVVETWDGEGYASGLQGYVRELVDFINAIGPRLPRLINLDLQEKARRNFDRQWKTRELTEEDKQRIIEMSKKSRFRTPQILPKAGQILGLFDDKG